MIHHELTFSAPPARVYALLTDAKLFAAATGAPAEIGTEGATFSLFGGGISGRQIELVANTRVVQAWRVGAWPAGTYSLVRFTLSADGTGTKLVLDHDAYPADNHPHLDAGWGARYFEPFAKYLAA